MKSKPFLTFGIITFLAFFTVSQVNCQYGFHLEDYLAFVNNNKHLEAHQLLSRHAPMNEYYSAVNNGTPLKNYLYLDSIIEKYELTQDELMMLSENQFLVTERISYGKTPTAMIDVYNKDLPFFVSTDAILDALHNAYSSILMATEAELLYPRLIRIINTLYDSLPQQITKYGSISGMEKSLEDLDLFVTVFKNLSSPDYYPPKLVSEDKVKEILTAIQDEKFVSILLFTDFPRAIDFSQFTVRGHYSKSEELTTYFKCMMWLGRTEIVLANAPKEWYARGFNEDGLKRLNMLAMMLNESLELSNVKATLNEIDGVIEALVGKSDNLRPEDLSGILKDLGIENASDLLSDDLFNTYQKVLLNSPEFNQQILSSFVMGTEGSELSTIPVSYYLLGQRYVIDSHVFSKLVYDNIVYHEEKVFRMMPDPLDAMFVLGNDNALPLLSEELEQWHYSSQLAAMRYLVEAHEHSFWHISFYNGWLQSLRLLNPYKDQDNMPLFMKTVAWQQEKLNTQLSSWAQLRHDNILYAKQSYTGGTGCSFPHSYVEPYPDFYRQIGNLARRTSEIEIFSQVHSRFSDQNAQEYFQFLGTTMDMLATIAQKELAGENLNKTETAFLQAMIHQVYASYDGWYIKLLFGSNGKDTRYTGDDDYLVADVHTQPTDRFGITVGNVLHVGTGKVNLGIFLAESPSAGFQPMAFVGPVLSYYEKTTTNFQRLNDETWGQMVITNTLPERPDWVNVYLADSMGNMRPPGRELAGLLYTGIEEWEIDQSPETELSVYPNPVSNEMVIKCFLQDRDKIQIGVYSLTGQLVNSIFSDEKPPGDNEIHWNAQSLPGGVYFIRLTTKNGLIHSKIVKH
ncbi:MAG: DUF3160 domain-containing protein [Bacteroidetes bacterium]|jgi:hypothetical protein|nr:DUF3160 domain-containing protein [Bacteroidota bacterium]